MIRKFFLLVLIGMMFLSIPIVSSIDLPRRPRVRIDKVEIPNLIDNIPIKVNDSFEINIYITKERLFPLCGEVVVYLNYAGIIQQEIGRSEDVKINVLEFEDKIPIICTIDAFDANSIQEKYSIVAVLYEKKLLGGFRERDRSSVESVNIVTEWWEKNKVIISDFNPPENWGNNNVENNDYTLKATADESDKITVNISNYAAYNFDIKVKINLIEKPPSDIPFIEGMGELKKEIGSATTTVQAGEENKEVEVICSLREADIERKKLDVQAVLYVKIDGQWYEVDTSTIQTIHVPLSGDPLDWIKEYGLLIWGIFVAGIGTILLIAVTVRLFFPYYKIKRKELKQKVEKMEKKKKKK